MMLSGQYDACTWKYAGSITANLDTIQIPSNTSEIFVVVEHPSYTTYILNNVFYYAMISVTENLFIEDGVQVESAYARIYITPTYVMLNGSFINGHNDTTTAVTKLYYR